MTRHQWQLLKVLTWIEWGWLFVSECLLVLVVLLLKVKGFVGTKKFISLFISKESILRTPNEAEMVWIHSIARLIRVAACHGPVRFSCLTLSLVMWGILARRGYLAEIRFGLHHEADESMFAHAWVVCNGVNMNDTPEIQKQISAFI